MAFGLWLHGPTLGPYIWRHEQHLWRRHEPHLLRRHEERLLARRHEQHMRGALALRRRFKGFVCETSRLARDVAKGRCL